MSNWRKVEVSRLAAHDFADLHGCVVDGDRELIGRNIVTPPNHKIAKVLAGYGALWSKAQVDKADLFAVGHTKPPIRVSREEEETDPANFRHVPR